MFSVDLFDREEYERWLAQAEHTLASAERDAASGSGCERAGTRPPNS